MRRQAPHSKTSRERRGVRQGSGALDGRTRARKGGFGLVMFRCTIIWEKIIVITWEKWTEDIVIIRERLEPRVA